MRVSQNLTKLIGGGGGGEEKVHEMSGIER